MNSKLANKDTLDFLGTQAQYLLVKSIIENKTLFLQVVNYLNPAVFTEEPLQGIVKIAKAEYDSKGSILGWRDIEYRLKEKLKTADEMEAYKRAFLKLKSEDTDGIITATEVGINHLKTLELRRILNNAREVIKDGGYTENRAEHIIEEIQAIDRIDTNEDVLTPEAFFELVVNSEKSPSTKTGFPALDKVMNGGLPKGNVGLIIAGTGVGKTTFGSALAMRSALAGNRVIHIFFEDNVSEIGQKYYATLTGRWTAEYNTTDPEKKEELRKEIMENDKFRSALARIMPKRMRNGEDRVEDVINFIRHKIAEGQKPDVVILDYMSCLKLSSDKRFATDKEFELLEKAMKKLECFAHDEGIAIWVEQQTNRNGQRSDTKSDRIGNVQGSFRMTQPAAFILYLERSDIDKWNRANVYMDKCRGCEPCEWTNILFNNGNCQIDFNDMDDNLPSTGEYNSAMAAADSEFKTTITDIMQ